MQVKYNDVSDTSKWISKNMFLEKITILNFGCHCLEQLLCIISTYILVLTGFERKAVLERSYKRKNYPVRPLLIGMTLDAYFT